MTNSYRLIVMIALLATLCLPASAQSYSIHVNVNATIRAQPSR
jgi:hypothetical protein